MKEIELSQGKVALVDDEDYEWLNQWGWYALRQRYNWYAVRMIGSRRTRRGLLAMHKIVLAPRKGMVTDHINHNGLDNRRCNLRECTTAENVRSSLKRMPNAISQYKGVTKNVQQSKKWIAQIVVNRQRIYLGVHEDEIEAARAYDRAALEHFGEFASLNNV